MTAIPPRVTESVDKPGCLLTWFTRQQLGGIAQGKRRSSAAYSVRSEACLQARKRVLVVEFELRRRRNGSTSILLELRHQVVPTLRDIRQGRQPAMCASFRSLCSPRETMTRSRWSSDCPRSRAYFAAVRTRSRPTRSPCGTTSSRPDTSRTLAAIASTTRGTWPAQCAPRIIASGHTCTAVSASISPSVTTTSVRKAQVGRRTEHCRPRRPAGANAHLRYCTRSDHSAPNRDDPAIGERVQPDADIAVGAEANALTPGEADRDRDLDPAR